MVLQTSDEPVNMQASRWRWRCGVPATIQAGRAHQWLGAGEVAAAVTRASLPPAVAATVRRMRRVVYAYGTSY